MLSLESTSCQTLQLVADLVESTSIPTRELEVVPKSHDDAMLRPPNTAIGERACCLGDRCICVWLARWRYGDDTDMAFVGTEFLLPVASRPAFRRSGTLPRRPRQVPRVHAGTCTPTSTAARARDPTFQPERKIPLQAFGNALGVACGDDVPTHASVANDSDGYRPEALLFVDETWADTAAGARRHGLAAVAAGGALRLDALRVRARPRRPAAHRAARRGRRAGRVGGAFLPAGNGPSAPPVAGEPPDAPVVDGGAAAAPAPDPAPAPAPALDPAPAPDPALASLADMMRCSRSVFEPQVRPLCGSFEDAGVPGALSRLHRELEECAGPLGAPSWVWSLDFAHAVARCAQSAADAERWVAAFGDLAQRFGGPAPPRLPGAGAQGPEARAATARLAYGAMLEAFAAQCAAELLPPDEAAGARVDQPRLARLYADAYGAAVWTSAHAEYLALVDDLLARASPPEDASARALMVPPPELYSVLNLSHLLHLGPLYERTVSPKCCTKAAQPLLSILARVTNAGSRGWESTLLAAAQGVGRRRARVHARGGRGALRAQPGVHPAARAPWRKRFATLRALRAQQTHADFKELATKAPTAVKEAVRLHLAGVLAADCATLDALRHTRQPAGQLVVPPQRAATPVVRRGHARDGRGGRRDAATRACPPPSPSSAPARASRARARRPRRARPSWRCRGPSRSCTPPRGWAAGRAPGAPRRAPPRRW